MIPPRRPPSDPAPTVSFREEPAGRETLAAIARDKPSRAPNPRSTKHYGDRISNAPGAVSPRVARALDTTPEIVVRIEPAGRETYAALSREIEAESTPRARSRRDEGPTIEIDGDAPDGDRPSTIEIATLPIESLFTFVVRAELALLESPVAQTDLVRERLLPVLPIDDARHVTRIEVRPWHDPGTVLVRVFCRVS